jgi:hypothetical protein
MGGVFLAPLDFHDTPVSGSSVYALSSDRQSVSKWSGSGSTWDTIGGPANQLVAGGFGTFAVRPSGEIFRYTGSGTSWDKVGDAAAAFAVNAAGLYRRDSAGVFKWSGTGTTWERIGGPARAIYAGGVDLYSANNATGDLYRYNGTPDDWTRIGGPGNAFAANVNGVYGLNAFGVYHWTGDGTQWVQIGGAADALYAGGNSLYAKVPFRADLIYYANSPNTWTKASSPATTFAVCDDALLASRSSGISRQTGTTWTQIRAGASAAIACGK